MTSNFYVQRNRQDKGPRDRIPFEIISVFTASGLEFVFSTVGAKLLSLNWHPKTSSCVELARPRSLAFHSHAASSIGYVSPSCVTPLFPEEKESGKNESRKSGSGFMSIRSHEGEFESLSQRNWKCSVNEETDRVEVQFSLEDEESEWNGHANNVVGHVLTYTITTRNEIKLTTSADNTNGPFYFPCNTLCIGKQYEVAFEETIDEAGEGNLLANHSLSAASNSAHAHSVAFSTRSELGSSQCMEPAHCAFTRENGSVVNGDASEGIEKPPISKELDDNKTTTTGQPDISSPCLPSTIGQGSTSSPTGSASIGDLVTKSSPTSGKQFTRNTSPQSDGTSSDHTFAITFDFRGFPTTSQKNSPISTAKTGCSEEEKFMQMCRNVNVKPAELTSLQCVSSGVSVRLGDSLRGKRTSIRFQVNTRKGAEHKEGTNACCPFGMIPELIGMHGRSQGTMGERYKKDNPLSPTDPTNEQNPELNSKKCEEELFMRKLQFLKRAENSVFSSD